VSTAVDRRVPPNLQVFKARLLFAANEVGSFWFGIVGYFLVLGIFVWGYFHNEPPFHSDGIVLLSLFALE